MTASDPRRPVVAWLRAALATFAVTVVALFSLAPSASATNFSVLLGGSQASSERDAALSIQSSGTGSGFMSTTLAFRGYLSTFLRVTGRCTVEQARTYAGCPRSSRVAGVQMRALGLGLFPTTLSGYVALEREPAQSLASADALLVARPYSPLFRTAIKPVRIELAAMAAGSGVASYLEPELRMSFPSLPTSLMWWDGGSRTISITTLSVNGRNPTSGGKRWLRLPGTCDPALSSVSATTTYTDGTGDTVTRTPAITACDGLTMRPEVMFNPKEYTILKRTGFDATVTLPDPTAGERQTAPRNLLVELPGFSVSGSLMSTLPTCDPGTAASGGCAAEARLGNVCLLSGPSRARVCGEIWNATPRSGATNDPGNGRIIFVVKKGFAPDPNSGGQGDAIAVFTGELSSVPDGSGAFLTIDDLPQLDPREWTFSFDAPVLRNPGTCNPPAPTARVRGWDPIVKQSVVSLDRWSQGCQPALVLTDSRDADDDGDGWADERFRPAFFDVFFSVVPDGVPDGQIDVTCAFKGWDGTIKGSTKLTDLDRDGRPDVCAVQADSDGGGYFEIAANDGNGHVTVLKRGVTVDGTAPGISIDEPGVHITRESFFDVFAEITDRNLASVTCQLHGSGSDPNTDCGDTISVCSTDPDVGCGDSICTLSNDGGDNENWNFRCRVENLDEGLHRIVLTATDKAGNASTAFFDVFADFTAPAVSTTDPKDDDCDGMSDKCFRPAFFDVFFEASDASFPLLSEPPQAECVARSNRRDVRGTIAWRSIPENSAWEGACQLAGLDEGLQEVELRVTDGAGHITVLRRSYTVDTTPPAIAIDEPGVHFTTNSFFDVFTELALSIDGSNDPTTWDPYRCSFNLEGDFDSISRPTSNCAPGNPIELQPGLNRVGLKVADAAGNMSVAFFDVFLDVAVPVISTVESRDADADGDGWADERFRPAFFDITYRVDDDSFALPGGRGYGSGSCTRTTRTTPSTSFGTLVRNANGTFTCQFADVADGDYDVEFSFTDGAGHVTVLKVAVTVDTTPPPLEGLSPADGQWAACGRWSSDPYAEDVIRVSFTLPDSSSDPVDVALSVNGGPRQSVSLDNSRTTQTAEIDCREMTTGMDVEYRIFATDAAGNESSAGATALVDKAPPVLIASEARDADSDGDGWADQRFRPAFFDIFVEASDVGSGVDLSTAACKVKPKGGTVKNAALGINSPNLLTCRVADVPEGEVEVKVSVADFSGHVTVLDRKFIVDPVGPVIVFDPGDDDADGDGYADDRLRGSDVLLIFDQNDSLSGIDPDLTACRAFVEQGGVVIVLDGVYESGDRSRCHFDGLPEGDAELEVTTADRVGNTTQRRTKVTVDATGPVVTTFSAPGEPDDCDDTSDACWRPAFFDVFFEAQDGAGTDNANFRATGRFSDGSTRDLAIGDLDGDGRPDVVSVESAPDGPAVVRLHARDVFGNESVTTRHFTVDSTPPAIAIDEPGVHFAESFFDVFVEVDEPNLARVRCGVATGAGAAAGAARCGGYEDEDCDGIGDLDGDGLAEFRCHVSDAGEGPHRIEFTATDRAGNTATAFFDVFVDTTPPAIAIDEPGVHFTTNSFFDVFTELALSVDGSNDPTTWDPYRCSFNLEGDFDSISRPTSNCAPGNPIELQPGLNRVGLKVADAAGNMSVAFFDVFLDVAAPTITTVDPRDADADGDGWADKRFRPAFFDITYLIEEDGSGVDEAGSSCVVKGGGSTRGGSLTMNSQTSSTRQATCSVDGLEEGDYEVELSVADVAGHVTVLKRSYTVDVTAPAVDPTAIQPYRDGQLAPQVAVNEEGVQVSPSSFFDVFFDIDDLNVTNATRGDAAVACSVEPLGGGGGGGCAPLLCGPSGCGPMTCGPDGCSPIVCSSLDIDLDGDGRLDLGCRVSGLGDGRHRVHLGATDQAGNAGAAFFDVFVDTVAPSVDTTDPGDADADGDGYADSRFRPAFFDITYRVDDSGSGVDPTTPDCLVITNEGRDRLRVTPTSQTTGRYTCPLTNLPDGDVEVEFSAADAAGHVTVLKSMFTVDTTAPEAVFVEPSGSLFAELPQFAFQFVDRNPHLAHFELSSLSDGRVIESGDCDDDDPTGGPCLWNNSPYSEDVIRVINWLTTQVQDDRYRLGLRLTDRAGNVASAHYDFEIDAVQLQLEVLSPHSGDVVRCDNDPDTGLGAIPIEYSLSNTRGVVPGGSIVSAAVNGGPVQQLTFDPTVAVQSGIVAVDCDDFVDGASVQVLLRGKYENETIDYPFSVRLDTQVPDVTIDPRSPVNINTASHEPLRAIVRDGNLGTTSCEFLPEVGDEVLVVFADCVAGNGGGGGGGSGGTCSSGQCELAVSPGPLPDGAYRLRVVHRDLAARTSEATHHFTVDNTAPTVTWTNPTPGAVLSSTRVTGQLSISDNASSTGTVTIRDAVTFDPIVTEEVWNFPSYSFTADVQEGPVRWRAEVRDAAGNTTVAPIEFTVDTTRPIVQILEPENNTGYEYQDITFDFRYESERPVTEIECWLDGSQMSSCSPGMVRTVPYGTHTFLVRVTDSSGATAVDQVTFFTFRMPGPDPSEPCPPGYVCDLPSS